MTLHLSEDTVTASSDPLVISNDILQLLFFSGVGAVALGALWYIFIKAPQARSRELEPWALKRGLAFQPPVPLGSHTQGYETSVLQGAFQGVPLVLRSARLVNTRVAGINGSTEIMFRAYAPSPQTFGFLAEHGPTRGNVQTGDPMFDAAVGVRTDNAQPVLAWLRDPQLRIALLSAMGDFGQITCTYASGDTTLRLGKPIAGEPQLDRALALAVLAARARPG